MIKTLKYIILFILLAIISLVLLENFISTNMITVAVSVLFASLLLYFFRDVVNKLAVNELIFICSFLAIIWIPLVGKKETISLEKRALAEFPTMRIENVWAFFSDFTKYFSDRLAYRNASVTAISKFKYKVFNVLPVPNIVALGKDGWLYYAIDPEIKDPCTPFTKEQLKRIKMNLDITTKWFDQRNIKYYLAIIPYKSRIYSEMMPDQLKLRMRHANYVQLLNYLEKDTALRLVNCTPELIKGKNVRPVYYKTDTHWNEYGAFLGYRKIIERVRKDFPQITPLELSDFIIDSTIAENGDLELMMGFSGVINTPKYVLKFKKPFTQ